MTVSVMHLSATMHAIASLFSMIMGLAAFFRTTPQDSNETMREVWEHVQLEERLRQEAEERAHELEQQAAGASHREEAAREESNETMRQVSERVQLEERLRQEAEERAHELEQQAAEARRREEAARKESNETMRQVSERVQLEERLRQEAEERAHELEQQAAEAKRREEAARKESNETMRQVSERVQLEERLRQEAEERAHELEQQAAEARRREEAARKEAKDANESLRRGIKPVEWPSDVQYAAAKERIEYDPAKLHFAICGAAGSGKSSLVNSLRGLDNPDSRSAKVGVTETTLKMSRYPDPREHMPFARFVWYDVPGAGTLSVKDWTYFNDQGLFVFDFIIVVYDVRFTEIDVGIIENCNRFKVPVFIVRSKADQHIENMLKEDGCDPGDSDYNEIYPKKMDEYILATRTNFSEQLKILMGRSEESHQRELLSKQRVYIVSGSILRDLERDLFTSPADQKNRKRKPVNKSRIIDEISLITDMTEAAMRRRYSEEQCRYSKRELEAFFARHSPKICTR